MKNEIQNMFKQGKILLGQGRLNQARTHFDKSANMLANAILDDKFIEDMNIKINKNKDIITRKILDDQKKKEERERVFQIRV